MTQPTLFDAPPVAAFQRLCDKAGTHYANDVAREILLVLRSTAVRYGQPSGWDDIISGLRKRDKPSLRAKLEATLRKVVVPSGVVVEDVPF